MLDRTNMASITENVIVSLWYTFIIEYTNEENRWLMDLHQLKLNQITVLTQVLMLPN